MIESFLSSGIAGFITAPVIAFIKGYQERKSKKLDIEQSKLEMAHELKMMEAQISHTKELQEMRLAELEFRSNTELNHAIEQTNLARQKTLYSGSKRMDAFISSVRPTITYLFTIIFLAIFTMYGYVVIYTSATTMEGFDKFFDSSFTQGMSYLFANIITFWFGQRLLEKKIHM